MAAESSSYPEKEKEAAESRDEENVEALSSLCEVDSDSSVEGVAAEVSIASGQDLEELEEMDSAEDLETVSGLGLEPEEGSVAATFPEGDEQELVREEGNEGGLECIGGSLEVEKGGVLETAEGPVVGEEGGALESAGGSVDGEEGGALDNVSGFEGKSGEAAADLVKTYIAEDISFPPELAMESLLWEAATNPASDVSVSDGAEKSRTDDAKANQYVSALSTIRMEGIPHEIGPYVDVLSDPLPTREAPFDEITTELPDLDEDLLWAADYDPDDGSSGADAEASRREVDTDSGSKVDGETVDDGLESEDDLLEKGPDSVDEIYDSEPSSASDLQEENSNSVEKICESEASAEDDLQEEGPNSIEKTCEFEASAEDDLQEEGPNSIEKTCEFEASAEDDLQEEGPNSIEKTCEFEAPAEDDLQEEGPNSIDEIFESEPDAEDDILETGPDSVEEIFESDPKSAEGGADEIDPGDPLGEPEAAGDNTPEAQGTREPSADLIVAESTTLQASPEASMEALADEATLDKPAEPSDSEDSALRNGAGEGTSAVEDSEGEADAVATPRELAGVKDIMAALEADGTFESETSPGELDLEADGRIDAGVAPEAFAELEAEGWLDSKSPHADLEEVAQEEESVKQPPADESEHESGCEEVARVSESETLAEQLSDEDAGVGEAVLEPLRAGADWDESEDSRHPMPGISEPSYSGILDSDPLDNVDGPALPAFWPQGSIAANGSRLHEPDIDSAMTPPVRELSDDEPYPSSRPEASSESEVIQDGSEAAERLDLPGEMDEDAERGNALLEPEGDVADSGEAQPVQRSPAVESRGPDSASSLTEQSFPAGEHSQQESTSDSRATASEKDNDNVGSGEMIATELVAAPGKELEDTPTVQGEAEEKSAENEPEDLSAVQSGTEDLSVERSESGDLSAAQSEPGELSAAQSEPEDMSAAESEPGETSAAESEPGETSAAESEPGETSAAESEPEDMSAERRVTEDISTEQGKPESPAQNSERLGMPEAEPVNEHTQGGGREVEVSEPLTEAEVPRQTEKKSEKVERKTRTKRRSKPRTKRRSKKAELQEQSQPPATPATSPSPIELPKAHVPPDLLESSEGSQTECSPASSYLASMREAHQRRDVEALKKAFQEGSSAYPNEGGLFAYLALALLSWGALTEARAVCIRGLQQDPDCPFVFEVLIEIELQRFKPDSARRLLNVALRRFAPESAFLRRAARAAIRLGDLKWAQSLIRQALELSPESSAELMRLEQEISARRKGVQRASLRELGRVVARDLDAPLKLVQEYLEQLGGTETLEQRKRLIARISQEIKDIQSLAEIDLPNRSL